MDNKAPTTLKMSMTTMDTNYLFFPINHRANNIEISIKTFNNHFMAGLFIEDENFHLYLWDKLLQQAPISLNILQQSRIHHHLSAYTHIFG